MFVCLLLGGILAFAFTSDDQVHDVLSIVFAIGIGAIGISAYSRLNSSSPPRDTSTRAKAESPAFPGKGESRSIPNSIASYEQRRAEILGINDSLIHTSKLHRVGAIIMEFINDGIPVTLSIHEEGSAVLFAGDGGGAKLDQTRSLRSEIASALKEAENVYLSGEIKFTQLTTRNLISPSVDRLEYPLPSGDDIQFIFGTFIGSVATKMTFEQVTSSATHPMHSLFADLAGILALFTRAEDKD